MPPRGKIICTNCHMEKTGKALGLCGLCYDSARREARPATDCPGCGQQCKTYKRGLCSSCYYQYIHSRRPEILCSICGAATKRTHGEICQRCYLQKWRATKSRFSWKKCGEPTPHRIIQLCDRCDVYRRRAGHDRPLEKETVTELRKLRKAITNAATRSKRQYQMCRRCRETKAFAKGYCSACYNYRKKTGRARPTHYIQRRCTNCQVPVQGSRSSGLCKRCRDYKWRTGALRPEKLWKTVDPWLGWCDCSAYMGPRPAVHKFTVRFLMPKSRSLGDTLLLCESCHQENQRMEKAGTHFDNRPSGLIPRER
jgi:hypothetical protein